MTISTRLLKKWRTEALLTNLDTYKNSNNYTESHYITLKNLYLDLNNQVLQMTQELIDHSLIKGK